MTHQPGPDGGPIASTIFALSSGQPPAAIAVMRISGAMAGAALMALAGRLPRPRRAALTELRDPATSELLDRALVLWFPGPGTATGEDLVELHLHGGRAVVAAVAATLIAQPGLRAAEPGEFTRRAFANGRIDLAEAEGLADLLAAETEYQRQQALMQVDGHVSRQIAQWRGQLVALAAAAEAMLDFDDEGDVGAEADLSQRTGAGIAALAADIGQWLARPAAERIHDGLTVVIGGPPNSGKSTLLNHIAQREVAIVSPIAGTTRDIVEVPLNLDGRAIRLADTAGLRHKGSDAIEAIGIDRAKSLINRADILVWLGDVSDCPAHPAAILVAPKQDLRVPGQPPPVGLPISAHSGAGVAELLARITELAVGVLPAPGEAALNARQRAALGQMAEWLAAATDPRIAADPVLVAEQLRGALAALTQLSGESAVELMLDQLFGRFCIGK